MENPKKVCIEVNEDELDCLVAACMLYNEHIEGIIRQFRFLDKLYGEMDESSRMFNSLIKRLIALRQK